MWDEEALSQVAMPGNWPVTNYRGKRVNVWVCNIMKGSGANLRKHVYSTSWGFGDEQSGVGQAIGITEEVEDGVVH